MMIVIELSLEQQKIVYKKEPGVFRVYGGAGTGKTLVAIERARYLHNSFSHTGMNNKIIIFTFNKNLKENIEKHLLDSGIEVYNIDQFIAGILKDKKYYYVKSDDKIRQEVVKSICGVSFEPEFILEEFDWIRSSQIPLKDYKTNSRIGRGKRFRLNESKKEEIILLLQKYRKRISIEKPKQGLDFYDTFNLAFCNKVFDGMEQYNHVLVDEAQDLTGQHLRFIQKLCPISAESNNSIMFFLDHKQTIYETSSWLQGGLRTFKMLDFDIPRGNSFTLSVCYRSSEEIVKAALSLIGSEEKFSVQRSLFEAETEKPFWVKYKNEEEELQGLIRILSHLKKHYEEKDIFIITTSMNQSFKVKKRLNYKINVHHIRNVKGLENKVVIFVGINDKRFMNRSIYHDKTKEEEFESAKRLMYVGMTRASQLLILSSYGTEQTLLSNIDESLINIVPVNYEFVK